MAGLPLFFKEPAALEIGRHGKGALASGQGFTFAAQTNSVFLNAIEFFEAAKHYPIVFTTGEGTMPVVILGLESQNYFVGKKGEWKKDAYIPAYVRKYPFLFMNVPEQNQFILCIDEAAPQYKAEGGKNTQALYNGDQPSNITKNALEFCAAFHNHHQVTRRFCEDMIAANLLVPTHSTIKSAKGREIKLGGFQVIDEKKLSALPEATVLEFFKKGWFPLIYASLISASNWKKVADMAS